MFSSVLVRVQPSIALTARPRPLLQMVQLQSMAASQGFKNTLFRKGGNEKVPEVTLPEDIAGLQVEDPHFADVKK